MKTNNINSLMQDCNYLEQAEHISVDDIINKVTQEVAELIEACVLGDNIEMYKEAGDVLINIYSVAEKVGLNLDFEDERNGTEELSPINLTILHGKWNSKIQGLRSRYRREDVSLSEAQDITAELVKEVLNYSNPDLGITKIIEKNIEKFRSRMNAYKVNLDVKDYISSIQDFPKEGIDFKDISPILESPIAFRYVCMELANKCRDSEVIVGLDSRGFLFGTWVAEYLGKPFVMIRKKGKLPGKTISQNYGLEYGSDVIELQEGSIKAGQKVSVIDDLLATGGTAKAAIDLVEKLRGIINNVSFVVSLDEPKLLNLESRKQLKIYNTNSIVSYK